MSDPDRIDDIRGDDRDLDRDDAPPDTFLGDLRDQWRGDR